jgi:hypothetical protein
MEGSAKARLDATRGENMVAQFLMRLPCLLIAWVVA